MNKASKETKGRELEAASDACTCGLAKALSALPVSEGAMGTAREILHELDIQAETAPYAPVQNRETIVAAIIQRHTAPQGEPVIPDGYNLVKLPVIKGTGKYPLWIDRDEYRVENPEVTGWDILELAEKLPSEYLVFRKRYGDSPLRLVLEAVTDIREEYSNRFITFPTQQTQGSTPPDLSAGVRVEKKLVESAIWWLNHFMRYASEHGDTVVNQLSNKLESLLSDKGG